MKMFGTRFYQQMSNYATADFRIFFFWKIVYECRVYIFTIFIFVDAYAKVIVKQDGKPAIKKQTRVRKSTTHPVFKETLVFPVSPNVETLRWVTDLN